jgi:hypothetical protein
MSKRQGGAILAYNLMGKCHEILDFRFLSWISFPQDPEYPIRAVSNILEICRDIHSSRCTICVIDTSGKSSTVVVDTGDAL